MNFIDETGKRYGRWTVLHRTQQKKLVRWVCRCDCGSLSEVRGTDLRLGKSASCGCAQKDQRPESLRRTFRREHNSWAGMRQRCRDKGHIEYHRYGGRGITYCESWNDFARFLADMGSCPEGHSLDRIDNDAPYGPSNCRWASKQEQSNNTSRSVRVTFEGQVLTLKQVAERLGLSYSSLHSFHRRRGMPLEEAIARSTELRTSGRYQRQSGTSGRA